MEETIYKATPGKTFLYFMVYKAIDLLVAKAISGFTFFASNEVLMNIDKINAVFTGILFGLTGIIGIILSFISVPLVRKLIVKTEPTTISSANNALLYFSLTYIAGIFTVQMRFPSADSTELTYTYLTAFIAFAFYLALYFYYKSKEHRIEMLNFTYVNADDDIEDESIEEDIEDDNTDDDIKDEDTVDNDANKVSVYENYIEYNNIDNNNITDD